MRDNLEGICKNSANDLTKLHGLVQKGRKELERHFDGHELDDALMFALLHAQVLTELRDNIQKVKSGEEPMSEFARFYCFVDDKHLTPELLLKVGFHTADGGSIVVENADDGELGFDPESNKWFVIEDQVAGTTDVVLINIKSPKNLAELMILAQALGFELDWKALNT